MNHNRMKSDIHEQYIAQKSKPATRANTTWPPSQNSNEQHKVDAVYYRRQSNTTCSHHHDSREGAKKVTNHCAILKQSPLLSRNATGQRCRSCCISSIRRLLTQQNSAADKDEQSNDEHSNVGQNNSNCIQWIVNMNPATWMQQQLSQLNITHTSQTFMWQNIMTGLVTV